MHGDNSNYSYLCMTSGSLIRVMSCIDILDMPVVVRSLVTDRNGRTRGEAICKLIRTIWRGMRWGGETMLNGARQRYEARWGEGMRQGKVRGGGMRWDVRWVSLEKRTQSDLAEGTFYELWGNFLLFVCSKYRQLNTKWLQCMQTSQW